MSKRITKLDTPPIFLNYSAVGGFEERRGPLGDKFDFTDLTDRFGQSTWEMSEAEMGRVALNIAMQKNNISHEDIGLLIAGDLQNQCVASSTGLDTFGIPTLGIYGACSTCTEAILLSSAMVSCGTADLAASVTTSHNLAAERQFRSPTEYGAQRTPTAQWTATAAGAFLLARDGAFPPLRKEKMKCAVEVVDFLVGRMIDGAITDGANMGGAMAFAAADSILSYFRESELPPNKFDLIVTGDLGAVGSAILRDILLEKLPSAASRHQDCGLLLYDMQHSDVHAGASGCGTSASVLASHFLPIMEKGELTDVLFLSTGALMSQSSVLQGNTIRGIAPIIHLHAKEISNA